MMLARLSLAAANTRLFFVSADVDAVSLRSWITIEVHRAHDRSQVGSGVDRGGCCPNVRSFWQTY
jgi:hypothetical protein